MPKYIDLEFAKTYLNYINTDSFEGKLQIIIDGVNQKIAKGTDNSEPDAELKLLAAQWVEYQWSKIPGAGKQKENDISIDYALNEDGIPIDFAKVMESYLDEEEIEDDDEMVVQTI
ncbi:hypothetical protein [Halonatronum saccharophilum]|uniref:hypothetical protein n=1 Tax=Halonatronum saccharophilum TaxID=150060 RepID=UPI000481C28C|nr:hypothetical protein [Halonatronum saccharophilum]